MIIINLEHCYTAASPTAPIALFSTSPHPLLTQHSFPHLPTSPSPHPLLTQHSALSTQHSFPHLPTSPSPHPLLTQHSALSTQHSSYLSQLFKRCATWGRRSFRMARV
uniref:Uncharacterized protein n=1 Tax=Desertifilum tharense IPPAS B-1220 TaxID=1781255 RepID=A0ACD5H1Q7_9CYAN